MSNQKDKTESSKSEVVKTAGMMTIGGAVALGTYKLIDTLRWRPSDLEGEDLKEQITVIMKLNLSKASRDRMDQWQVSVSQIFEKTLKALAEKYELKNKEGSPHQIVQHLFDQRLIEDKLKDKLCAVVEQRNNGTHEALSKEELRAYFQQFQDILPVLKERL